MTTKKRLRRGWFSIIKHSVNPLTLRIARSSYGPFSIIRHSGRRSGKLYETPIIAIPVEDGFVIELTYGYDVDWHKNVLAAGGCTVIWQGRQTLIDEIEPLDTETGMAAFPWLARVLLRLLRRKHFEKLKSKQL